MFHKIKNWAELFVTFLSTRHRQMPQHEEKHEQFTPKKDVNLRRLVLSCLIFGDFSGRETRTKSKYVIYV